MDRDRYLDLLRALAISLVVSGHWLITALQHAPDGTLEAPELLARVPWTQWLTLGFQIMPLFFLAGGCAAAGSWTRSGRAAAWVRGRAVRLLLPTAAYVALVLLAVAVCSAAGVDPGILGMVGWAMAMQFWFLPVYLLLTALTPLLHRAHRRLGLVVPALLGLLALGADLAASAGAPGIGALAYLAVWGTAYQLGLCWADGLLTPRRAAVLALAGAAAFAALITVGPYPPSLILVSTETVSNTNPPSPAMLAWVCAQSGLCLLLAPAARRLLRRERLWRLVGPVGRASMTVYLWHMLPVLCLAGLFYLTRLAPEPALGSGGWWLLRLPWLLLLSAVLLLVLAALRPLESGLRALAGRLGRDRDPRQPALFWAGLGLAVWALARWAVQGLAHDGRFPALPALLFAAGTLLVLGKAGPPRPTEESAGAVAG